MSSVNTNVYYSPNLNIIKPSENVLDLRISMSNNCSFAYHINVLCKKCTDLSGWILRSFTSCDSTTMMTMFKALIQSRLDYCSQLWSPHLTKHIVQIEKVQRSFTKYITGMREYSYIDRLSQLKLYSLQRRRDHYCIIYVWKSVEGAVPNYSNLSQYYVATQSVEEDPALFRMLMLVDLVCLHTTVSGGVPSDCLILCPNVDVPLLVLLINYSFKYLLDA